MATKKDDKCLINAFDDEKLFVLMARDVTSPLVVIEWIKQNIGLQPREKLFEALDCAIHMHETMAEMNKRKELEKQGWNLITKIYPDKETDCEVLFSDGRLGVAKHLADALGRFILNDGQEDKKVIAWKYQI